MSDWNTYDWSDVAPLEVPEVPGHVAQIAYSEEFKRAMALFRACAAKREMTPRVLALTRRLIELNPAHYSIWDYRLALVKKIGNSEFDYTKVGITPRAVEAPPIGEDGDWLNQFTLSHAKNYQVWNYRQHLIDAANPLWYRGERVLAKLVFEDDAKNFHAWSHLKNVVTQSIQHGSNAFGDGSCLLEDCDAMLREDVFNNSVWSFRYFVFAHFPALLDAQAELDFVSSQVQRAPSNESVWSYTRGLVAALAPPAAAAAAALAAAYPAEPRAVELLAEISEGTKAHEMWQRLCELEPARAPFWQLRMAAAQ